MGHMTLILAIGLSTRIEQEKKNNSWNFFGTKVLLRLEIYRPKKLNKFSVSNLLFEFTSFRPFI